MISLEGLSVQLMDEPINVGEGHIFVGIVVRKPVPPQVSGTTTTPGLVVATEEESQDEPTEEESQDEPTKCVIKRAKTDSEIPLVLEIGGILVVGRLESLHPEPGGIAMISISWKATAIENKDREKVFH